MCHLSITIETAVYVAIRHHVTTRVEKRLAFNKLRTCVELHRLKRDNNTTFFIVLFLNAKLNFYFTLANNRPCYKPVTRVRLRLEPILAHCNYITPMTLPHQAQ